MLELLTSTFLSIPLIGAFSLFTLGVVVIYRASRVLNLAHGAMAMTAAYVSYALTGVGVPALAALVLAVVFGGVLGVVVELLFVRRLRPQGPTAQTVGTVAVAALLIAGVARVFGSTPIVLDASATVFPAGVFTAGGTAVRVGEVGLLVVGLGVSGVLFAYFRFTDYGLAMRGAAVNREAASLMGVDPDRAAAVAWGLGGATAALAGVLLANVTTLDPFTLSLQALPAFVAALLGGLESLVGAIVGAVVVGLVFGLVPLLARIPGLDTVLAAPGAPQLVLTVLALVVMAVRGRRVVGTEEAQAGLSGGRTMSRRGGELTVPAILTVGLLVVWPFLVPSLVLGQTLVAVQFAVIAVSLVVLTGWVGQISLAQGTFVGVGAFIAALFTDRVGLGFPVSLLVGTAAAGLTATALGAVALRVRGLYLAVATLIFAWMGESYLFRSSYLGAEGGSTGIDAEVVGEPGAIPSFDLTSRTTLYYLFVAILVLVVTAMANLRDTRTGRSFFAVRGSEMAAASLGIDVTRVKLVAFGLSGALAGLGGTLLLYERQTVASTDFFVSASLQFLAIAVVGGLVSLGGAIAAGLLFASLDLLFFNFEIFSGYLPLVSAGLLTLVLLTAPSGLAGLIDRLRALRDRMQARPVGGRVAAARPDSMQDEPEPDATTDGDEAARGPVASVAGWLRRVGRAVVAPLHHVIDRRSARRVPDRRDDWFVAAARTAAARTAPVSGTADGTGLVPAADDGSSTPAVPVPDGAPREPGSPPVTSGHDPAVAGNGRRPLPPNREDRPPLVEALGITVRFGGLTAVDDATLTVREGEIVGLIGPNGAGKTTLFNAILGLNDPAEGIVRLYGRDAGHLPPHLRARMGVARTFQVIQLFEELTVFDNLLVATHLHADVGVLSNMAATRRTVVAEAAARRRVRQVLRLLDLGDVADESVRDLPFGVLRMVELGRALVTGAKILMLDEAASGLNDAETDRLVAVVRRVRDLGVSVLLIEHDVPMVCGVSDFVYVLDQGEIIAADTPAAVQRDPAVITAYIGGAPAVTGDESAANTTVTAAPVASG